MPRKKEPLLDDNDQVFAEPMGEDGEQYFDDYYGPFNVLRKKSRDKYVLTTHFNITLKHYCGWAFHGDFEFGPYDNLKAMYVRHFKNAKEYTDAGYIREGMVLATIEHCLHSGQVGKPDMVYLLIPSAAPANGHIAKLFEENVPNCKVMDLMEKNNWSELEFDLDVAKEKMHSSWQLVYERFLENKERYWDKPYSAHGYSVMSRKPIKNIFRMKKDVNKNFLMSLRHKRIVLIDDTLSEGGTAANVVMLLGRYGVLPENIFLITIMKDF